MFSASAPQNASGFSRDLRYASAYLSGVIERESAHGRESLATSARICRTLRFRDPCFRFGVGGIELVGPPETLYGLGVLTSLVRALRSTVVPGSADSAPPFSYPAVSRYHPSGSMILGARAIAEAEGLLILATASVRPPRSVRTPGSEVCAETVMRLALRPDHERLRQELRAYYAQCGRAKAWDRRCARSCSRWRATA